MKRSLLLISTALILTGCNEKTADINWFDALKAFITGEVPQKYLIDALPAEAQRVFLEQYESKTPTGSYLSGRFAQSNFDWETASKYFSEALAADPKNLELERRTMVLAMGAGNYQEAFDHARATLKDNSAGSLPRLFLTLETLKSGNYAQTLTEGAKIPDDGISEFVKPLILSWAAAGEKKLDINSLNKNVVHFYHAVLIADYLNNREALKTLALRDYAHMGLSAKSMKQLADILSRHDLNAQAKEILRNVPENERNDIETGFEPIKNPIEGVSRALFDMATVLYQDYPDSARLFAEMSLYLNPGENDSRILMAHMSSQFKRYDEAIAFFNEIDTDKDPEMAIKVKRQIAELLEQSGKTEQAISELQSIVSKTKNVDAQIQIGDMYREQEKFDQALDEYNKAFAILNNNITAEHWNLFYARGISNERLKKWDAAEADLKSALALEPDHPYILNYLGYSWIERGVNTEEATRMIEKAVRLRPDDGYIVDSLGWAYFKQGKYQLASDALERAIELSPYDATINDHLGDAYWKVGRKTEARFQWRRALSMNPDADLTTQLHNKIDNGLAQNGAPASPDTDSQAWRLNNKLPSHD